LSESVHDRCEALCANVEVVGSPRPASETEHLLCVSGDIQTCAPLRADRCLKDVGAWCDLESGELATFQPTDFLMVHQDPVRPKAVAKTPVGSVVPG
jgi:hypothetical protein